MKLVSFKELCALPVGTVFQSYAPHYLGPVMMFGGALPKGDEEPRDFLQAGLGPQTMFGTYWGAAPVKLPDGSLTRSEGLYISTPSDYQRWALYDYDDRFLVWEEADRKRLASWLLDPAEAAEHMEDFPVSIIEVS